MNIRKLLYLIAVFFLFVTLSPSIQAAAVSWDGNGDGLNWTDPANWDNDAIPGATDDVTIDADTTVNIPASAVKNVAIGAGISGNFSGDEGILNNGSKSDYLDSNATGYYTVTFDLGDGNAQTVTQYSVTAGNNTSEAPRQWVFEGSHDNTNWTTIDTKTDETGWQNFLTRIYTVDNETAYRYYRFYNFRGWSQFYQTNISELELLVETAADTGYRTINSLTLGNASGTTAPTIIFEYDAISEGPMTIDDGDLTAYSGSTITHKGDSTSVAGKINLSVSTGNATLGGTVLANSKGFTGGSGPGTIDGASGSNHGGAGYGGQGGKGRLYDNGEVYGSFSEPEDWGSGGPNYNSDYRGGAGGGAIKISVAGTTTVNGTVSANGGNYLSTTAGTGGSGGSVYLTTNTLEGNGTISANGGLGYSDNAGSGGGGRIALYYSTYDYTGAVTAYGGAAGRGYGGAGTIYLKASADTYGQLVVDNNDKLNTWDFLTGRTLIDSTVTFKSITLRNYGNLEVGPSANISYTSFEWSDAGVITDSGGTMALLSGGGAMTVPSTAILFANTQRTWSSLNVDGTITHTNNFDQPTYKVNITVSGNTTIGATGKIDVTGKGYQLAFGEGTPASLGSKRAGGSYGGEGSAGESAYNEHGSTYGSITEPTDLGSGGGRYNTSLSQYIPGIGGGAIRLDVTGTLINNGVITANGGNYTDSVAGSGGSGGSVYITTGILEGNGSITSNGGNANSTSGGGGGGRIAVYFGSTTYSGSYTAYGGTGWASAGAGTIYLKDTDNAQGNLLVDNNDQISTYDYHSGKTIINETISFDQITIRNYGNVGIGSSANITYSSLDWGTKGIITDNGGTFDLVSGGGNLTVPETSKLFLNTARTYTAMIINGTLTHSNNFDSEQYKLEVTITGDVTVGQYGSIDVAGRGYSRGNGPGAPTGYVYDQAGGGYGGAGGAGDDNATGGTTYGSTYQPTDLGSSGGLYNSSTVQKPGSGGGAIKMTISGTLTVTGSINADGQDYYDRPPNSGGSGGSVYLIVGEIAGAGPISSDGGNGYSTSGGGGGGGRIAIYYEEKTYNGTITVTGGTGFSSGGEDGTIVQKATQAELISSPFDSADSGTVLSRITWTEVLEDGTDVKFQLRTAPDDDNGAPGTWGPWLGPTGTDDYYTDPTGGETINPLHSDTTDDQWYQYKAVLTASEGDQYISTLQEVQIQYVVNTPPTVSITDGPVQNSDGIVTMTYTVTDPEESNITMYITADIGITLSGGLAKADTAGVAVSDATVLPSAGTIMIDSEMISYTSKTGNTLNGTITRGANTTRDAVHAGGAVVYFVGSTVGGVGTTSTGTGKSAVWTAREDLGDIETTTAKIRLVANDLNAANQIGSDLSGFIVFDTKAPISTDLFINGRLAQITPQASDENNIFMKISNNSDLSADGQNENSGSWIAYETPYSWTMPEGTKTVYIKYKDQYGNETETIAMTAPDEPSSVMIQDASFVETSTWRLFVAWAVSDEPVNGFNYYQVYRSTDNVTYTPLAQVDTITQNFHLDTGLDNQTTYYYLVTVVDDHGNESEYNAVNQISGVATRAGDGLQPDGSGGSDTAAPVITELTAINITTTTATITWTTDELSNATVGYSTDTSYTTERGVSTMGISHSVTLTNLSPGTQYYYRAISYDPVDNKGQEEDSSVYTFTTSTDTTGPVITNIKSFPGQTTAGITWSTNEAATSVVEYSINTSYSESSSSASLVQGHALTLTGLTAGSTYNFRVKSVDASGNPTTSESSTFTTFEGAAARDETPPSISDITVSEVTATSAMISWSTNEDADGKVEYGETTTYERGAAEGDHEYEKKKEVYLIGLAPSTEYNYKVVAVDEAGNVNMSSNATFTTETQDVLGALTDDGSSKGTNPPTITSDGPTITEITGTSVTLSWTTSKKSTSQVYYKEANVPGNLLAAGDATLFVSDHEVTISNLTPATSYEYQVKSADVNGNYVISKKYLFNTTLPEVASVRVEEVTESSAVIAWRTAIPTNGLIEYVNTTTREQETYKSPSLSTNHSSLLRDLAGSTVYSFTVVITDEAGNTSRSAQYSFTTENDSDGPQISVVNSRSTIVAGQDKVQTIVTWNTNEVATGKIEYAQGGIGDTFDQETPISVDFVTNHIVIVSNLKPATVYRFRVVSEDRTGNTTTSDPYVLLTPQREVSALDLIIKNLEGTFGWAKRIGG